MRDTIPLPRLYETTSPMLRTLRIRNLATIDDLTVEFGPGLNVLTGETGAGKSIVIDALGLAAGDRADPALVRSGCERATVEAVFAAPWPGGLEELLDDRGVALEDDQLIARRDIPASGAGRVFVNGSPATLAVLREAGDRLVELHGQHEHQSLLSAERHLDLLDAYADHGALLRSVSDAWRAIASARDELERLRSAAADRQSRFDLLRRTVHEIDAVGPRAGELAELDRERHILHHAEKIARAIDESLALLYDDEASAVLATSGAARRVNELAAIDPALEDAAARLEACRIELQDLSATLRAYREDTSFDAAKLDTIEGRRAAIERLLLRYGPGEDDALRERATAAAEVAALEDVDRSLADAEANLEAARAIYAGAARKLAASRATAAARLGPSVESQLRMLALDKARFEIAITTAAPGPKGDDRAEFVLAANPGEAARPLAKTASGGELSRTMLALHVVLEGAGAGSTMVFDEVDTGVGGAVAAAVGARLAKLARRHQVLCVTHLPQVAAHADRHFVVSKRVTAGRTVSEVTLLDAEARVEEMARMLGGLQPSAAARRNAAELLAEADAARSRTKVKGRTA